MEIKKNKNSLLDIISGNSEINHVAETVEAIVSDLTDKPLIPVFDDEEIEEKPKAEISAKTEKPKKAIVEIEEDEEDEEEPETVTLTGAAAAKPLTLVIDMLQSRGCGLISKRNHAEYRLSKSDKKDFENALAEYLKTTNFEMSPLGAFMATALMIIGANFAQAYSDKEEDKENAKIQAAAAELKRRTAQSENMQPIKREVSPVPFDYGNTAVNITSELPKKVDVKPLANKGGRKKFAIDDRGKFINDNMGKYLKVSDRNEVPSPEILRLLKMGKTNKEILTIINQN